MIGAGSDMQMLEIEKITYQIRYVAEQYFAGLDNNDKRILASCFDDDAEVCYHYGTPGQFRQRGGDVIVDYLIKNGSNSRVRTHVMANFHVAAAGVDRATAITHAVANLWRDDRILVRGLRYEDDFILAAGKWRIAARVHRPLWQYEAIPTSPSLSPLTVMMRSNE